jgi:hypothetical protein
VDVDVDVDVGVDVSCCCQLSCCYPKNVPQVKVVRTF